MALEAYHILRSIAYEMDDMDRILLSYQSLAQQLKLNGDYEISMICYKKILLYAWVLDMKELELETMHNLASSFFHMGQVSQAKVYFERANRGIYEADHSSAKIVAK